MGQDEEDMLRKLRTDPSSVSEADVVRCLHIVPKSLLEIGKGVSMRGVAGAPDWYTYESMLWELSEAIRVWLRVRPRPAGKNPVCDAIAEITLDTRLGKGRQNFVLILGERGGHAYGNILGQLLADADVAGHAIKALLRSRISGHVTAVEQVFFGQNPRWIRTAAKKYITLMRETENG